MLDKIAEYLLTQGILGVSVIMLSLVCLKLYNKSERIEKEKIEILEAWRKETKEQGDDQLEVLKGNSQSLLFLANKIEVGKANDRTSA